MEKPYIDSRKSKLLVGGPVDNEGLISENKILKEYLKEKLQISDQEIQKIIEKKKEISLPISIFRNKLSSLEVVVKYLKEFEKLSFSEIAKLLNRDERTIWHAYQRAEKKNVQLKILDSEIKLPVSLFTDRKYAPLEVVVAYLKDSHQLKFNEIAVLLERSPKTIWTIYQRTKKKNAS